MGNEWIEYVKSYAKDHNLKYNEALREAGKSYKEMKGKFIKTNNKIKGNGLKANTFKELLEASYSGKEEVAGFVIDKSISSKTSKVYIHKPSGHVVVAHQGTTGMLDWGNNATFALSGDTGY